MRAFVMDSIGDSIDPMPTAPAVIRKSRRENLPALLDIPETSLIDMWGWKMKRNYHGEGAQVGSVCNELLAIEASSSFR
jgi:hypothetical protein